MKECEKFRNMILTSFPSHTLLGQEIQGEKDVMNVDVLKNRSENSMDEFREDESEESKNQFINC